ncbi:MAG: 3-phosphoshikimate 1-carboxyvinyltransferase [Myxococcota bacterium]
MRVDARVLHAGVLTAPPSKSDAHRALVLADILGLPVEVPDDAPHDMHVLRRGLRAIHGATGTVEVDCEDAGAPFRFLLTYAAIQPGLRTRFTGTSRLGERPHGPLLDSLRAAGVSISVGEPWPVVVDGGAWEGEPVVRVDGTVSSQYVSSLLLGAAALQFRQRRAWTVELTGTPTSVGYLDLTLGWMRRAGFVVDGAGTRIIVSGHQSVTRMPPIPADWSSLGYLLLCAWASGSTVQNVDVESEHPDAALVGVLRQVGLSLTVDVEGNARVDGMPTKGIVADAKVCPDLVPTLAAWSCVLPAPSMFHNVGILRGKESDRVEGIRQLARSVGAHVVIDGELLEVHPTRKLPGVFHVESAHDHRRVMSAVTLAVLTRSEVDVDDGACVRKSFPGFWDQLRGLGVTTS